MDQAVNITGLAASFRLIVEGACQVVRAYCREDWVIGPRFGLINNGLMRRLLRFERIVALLLAGVADPVRPARAARAIAASAAGSERKRCERWPSRKGWLLAKLGWRIALYGYRLQLWLGDPENAALVRSSRKLRRVLRPIWNALTTDPLPDCLREPPREAKSDATHKPSSEPPRGAATPAPEAAGEPAAGEPAQAAPEPSPQARPDLRPMPDSPRALLSHEPDTGPAGMPDAPTGVAPILGALIPGALIPGLPTPGLPVPGPGAEPVCAMPHGPACATDDPQPMPESSQGLLAPSTAAARSPF